MLARIFVCTVMYYLSCLILLVPIASGADNVVDTGVGQDQSTVVTVTAPVDASNSQLIQINRYRDQIADLESEYGPYHTSLLEPLSALAQIYSRDADYEAAAELLGRHLQVLRTEQGLDNPALIPVIETIIPNSLQLGDYAEVSDHFDHIRHLRGRDNDPALVLEAMADQADWFLTRVYVDEPRLRVRNFSAARDLFRDMLDYAEDAYGEDNPAIIPWLYREAANQYRLLAMLNAGGSLGSDAVDRILRFENGSRVQLIRGTFFDSDQLFGPGSNVPILDGDERIGEDYLEEGLGQIGKIRDMMEDNNDLEAQAMADVYYADFQLLLDRGSAQRNYRKAHDKFLEAGIASERVEAFFARPILLPVGQYFDRLEQALFFQEQMAQQPMVSDVDNSADSDAETSLHLGPIVAWNEALPYSQQPPQPSVVADLALQYQKAEVSFTVNRNGETSSVKVLSTDSDDVRFRRNARSGVREMRFRPRIVEGRSQRVRNVRMQYLYPVDP